jgi:hypothetical protein
MASTYSALKIELIGTGEQSGTWGATTDTNLDVALGEAITGSADVNFATAADVTVTLTDTNTAQTARNLRLNITESSTGIGYAGNLILGSGCQIEKLYLINNGTTAAKTIKNTTGTGISIPAGKSMFVFNNGVNVVDVTTYLSSLATVTLTTTGAASVGSTLTVAADGTFNGTGQVKLPAGTTAQRSGSPATGMLRFNSSTGNFEGYDGTTWGGIGGAQAGGAISINNKTASSNYDITTTQNGFSVGPITIASGVTISVATDSRWVII